MLSEERKNELRDKINLRASEFQEQFHEVSSKLIKSNPNFDYQDCMNVFIFRKLAQLETYMFDVVDELKRKEEDENK